MLDGSTLNHFSKSIFIELIKDVFSKVDLNAKMYYHLKIKNVTQIYII